MKRNFCTCMVVTAVFLFAASALALSDAEYRRMKQDSPAFAKADRELTQAWNEAKRALGKSGFDRLKKEQREWIVSGRDERAEELMDGGMSRSEAYAAATTERVREIRGSLKSGGAAPTASARHGAYMKAARDFVENHRFPDGETISDEDLSLGLGDFSENKLAICDVNGDGKPELLIFFEATHMAAKMGYVCGFDERAKKLTVQLAAFPAFDFFDNGCVKVYPSHNQGLAGGFYPYGLSKFNGATGEYEAVGYADAWDKSEFPEDFEGNSFPDKLDRTGDGFIYYIDDESEGLTSETPVDTPVYEKWEARWIGGAKLVEPDWVSADAKGLKALERKR